MASAVGGCQIQHDTYVITTLQYVQKTKNSSYAYKNKGCLSIRVET